MGDTPWGHQGSLVASSTPKIPNPVGYELSLQLDGLVQQEGHMDGRGEWIEGTQKGIWGHIGIWGQQRDLGTHPGIEGTQVD